MEFYNFGGNFRNLGLGFSIKKEKKHDVFGGFKLTWKPRRADFAVDAVQALIGARGILKKKKNSKIFNSKLVENGSVWSLLIYGLIWVISFSTDPIFFLVYFFWILDQI